MSASTEQGTQLHGGRLVAKRLRAHGVSKLFTLSGGHLFSIFDGCRDEGIDIVDVRHEQSAAFAAEGWAKATREPGVAALTAGPGVTNGMSGMASALQNGSPMVVLGGRAPAFRWGQGSLQEIDHIPFVEPVTKLARTAQTTAEIPGLIDEALHAAANAPTGPAFVDFPLDQVFMESDGGRRRPASMPDPLAVPAADGDALDRAAELLRSASRPVVMAGTGLYWARGEQALRAPVRGAVGAGVPQRARARLRARRPPDVLLARARGRPEGRRPGARDRRADGLQARLRRVVRRRHRDRGDRLGAAGAAAPARGGGGAVRRRGGDAGRAARGRRRRRPTARGGSAELREVENEKRAGEQADLTDDRAPLHPLRVYHELNQVLDRNAIVIGDGGDFVSFAGRVIETYEPGCWMDPGPYGCLGSGPGYALAAKVAHPDRQVCLLLGDGAFGFAGMEFDSFVRHGLPIVGVMGNNGIWALEKHPMEFLYGYSVAAELQPECRYDEVVRALGGHGELVQRPEDLRPALERAFASGKPALVNVLTDPEVVYPRKANLA